MGFSLPGVESCYWLAGEREALLLVRSNVTGLLQRLGKISV